MKTPKSVVIFGGTGFIGTHLTQHLMREYPHVRITLVDLLPPRNESYSALLQSGILTGQVRFVRGDVRERIPTLPGAAKPDLMVNLAAIHREPGHIDREYFETNLPGAENVCAYAAAAGCERMVFISSISLYGPTEDPKDEQSLPVPETPYGASKLTAEKIHMAWQKEKSSRRLLIVRPGVVFGPGEGGNVTRLIQALVSGYFVYTGNRDARKAGGYVKELCHVILFGLDYQSVTGEAVTLLNFSMDPPTRVETMVETIRKVAGISREPFSVPRSLLLGISYVVDCVARVFGIEQPISPVRVRKLFRSTSIYPAQLKALGYAYKYTLEEAFRDWKQDVPSDFTSGKKKLVSEDETPAVVVSTVERS